MSATITSNYTITSTTTSATEVAAGQNVRDAARLLHEFDALTLGEGDLTAGANTLALMALTLACTAKPGSCLTDTNIGSTFPVGMGMLLSGSLSCAIVDDLVLSALQTRQEYLYGHIRQRAEKQEILNQRKSGRNESSDDVADFKNVFDNLDRPEILDIKGSDHRFVELLGRPPDMGTKEILHQPTFYANVGSVKGLATILDFANQQRLLVHTALTDDGNPTRAARVCSEVMNGSRGRGHVIVTDPLSELGAMVREDSEGLGWAQRLLWLSEDNVAPAFELPDADVAGQKMTGMDARFHSAFLKVMSNRLNFRTPSPLALRCDKYFARQAEWIAFLKALEPRFPGITGTLRPLLASLIFGLMHLAAAGEQSSNLRLALKGVEAFARLLALRMVSARETMLETGQRKRLEALRASIRFKLIDGPLDVRELTRKCHRLDAATCQQVLEDLVFRGLVNRTGKKWALNTTTSHPLTVDV